MQFLRNKWLMKVLLTITKVRFWYNIIGESHQLDVYRRTSYKSSDNDAMFILESFKSSGGIDFWDSASIIASLDDTRDDFEVCSKLFTPENLAIRNWGYISLERFVG